MKLYFQQRVIAGFLVAIVIISALAVYSYLNNRRSVQKSLSVAHSNEVLYHTEQVWSLIANQESAQRGYSITGDDVYLKPYRRTSEIIYEHLAGLRNLISDNVYQQRRAHLLEELIDRKLKFNQQLLRARQSGFEEARVLHASLIGKKLMDDIYNVVRDMQNYEKALLKLRTDQQAGEIRSFNYTYAALLSATALLLVFVFITINRNLRARFFAEASSKTAARRIQDIYDNAPCGYHSLDANGVFIEINKTWLDWLRYDREEVVNKLRFSDILSPENAATFQNIFGAFKDKGIIRNAEFDIVRKDNTTFPILLNAAALYDDDGNFLKSRSTVIDYSERREANEKILALNRELEAFTYSVSHDLRAPLRSIDGYARILDEDYAAKLDDEGRRVLNVVMNNARRMGQLIDDLLDFSRIGRKEIVRGTVDMLQLVQSVSDEMLAHEEGRSIDVEFGALEPAIADLHLLKQVWVNLLSNAMKYTGKKERAFIQIASHKNGTEIIYSVRDNGAGFDMQYVHKLFGVFQRLHRAQDFQGTGVGLAIVHRIIARHGGRVWAEGKVNEGATFYFTLPKDTTSKLPL
ncbi:MAG TPA: CHASE3 domain-containing protein [Ohtaekwangia sp.]|uniref:CHASE3 domain-containing protein n=1 Tax=Ohtaekwangia sp. TaxID=2066019 RepID=UPI002F93884E